MSECHIKRLGTGFDKVYTMKISPFGSALEAIIYPLLVLTAMWLVFWADHLFPLIPFYKYGVMPGALESWKGVLFMPLLHSHEEINHILNNSIPTAVLLGAIVYYYRQIAVRVFFLSWLFTGLGVWLIATNNNAYHIGMSGVIYAMAGFLFTSGIIRKYKPLQAISLFVAFLYGGMIWGVFPMKEHVSWEGHLSGLVVGILLAILYRKRGPQPPKYSYEIEQEMGIEPPDFEGELNERIRLAKLQNEELLRQQLEIQEQHIVYHFVPKDTISKPEGNTDQ